MYDVNTRRGTASAYDQTAEGTTTKADGISYTGREWDAWSATEGIYYYRNRYYDPDMGRFISEDPIGFGGGFNLYGYVENSPIRYTDPEGLAKVGVCSTENPRGGNYHTQRVKTACGTGAIDYDSIEDDRVGASCKERDCPGEGVHVWESNCIDRSVTLACPADSDGLCCFLITCCRCVNPKNCERFSSCIRNLQGHIMIKAGDRESIRMCGDTMTVWAQLIECVPVGRSQQSRRRHTPGSPYPKGSSR